MLCKMPRFAQLVMGPAGSGKSSFCSQIVKHCEVINRVVHVVNLDPAADYFDYPVYADVRELVSVEDVMEDSDLRFGPNGGLVFCMEYLIENLDWLKDQLDEVEEDYILFDCPGQIELYTHLPVMKKLVDCLTNWNFHVCGVFLIDAQFMIEPSKFVSGVMSALSAMVSLEIPHVNVMTKLDLLNKQARKQLERYLDPDMKQLLMEEMSQSSHLSPTFQKLNQAIAGMIDDYSLVGFQGLDVTDEESVHSVLVNIDTAIQYGEDMEHKESKEIDQDLDGLREALPSDLNGD